MHQVYLPLINDYFSCALSLSNDWQLVPPFLAIPNTWFVVLFSERDSGDSNPGLMKTLGACLHI